MYMLLDSGAGTTWVTGSTCKSLACTMHNSYGPEDSTTLKVDSKPFKVSYGSGKVSGHLATDTISVAGISVEMTFGITEETSDDFTHYPFDGILGLATGKGATDNFMDVLMKTKSIGANVFGISIGRNSDGVNNGQITFGGVEKSKYVGDISYTAVSAKGVGDWSIPMDNFGYDGQASDIAGRLAYIDTGTSYMFGPKDDVAALHKVIPGAFSKDGGVSYVVPCSSNKPLTIAFSGVTYELSPEDWMTKVKEGCVSNIIGHEVIKGSWLLGALLLKNVYSVFDAAEKRIGFASKAELPKVASSTIIGAPSATGRPDDQQSNPATSPVTAGPDGISSSPGSMGVGETGAKPSATATHVSPGARLEGNAYITIFWVIAMVAVVA